MGADFSELDVLMLGRAFPKHCSVTAKKILKYMPFLGWFSYFLWEVLANGSGA